MPDGGLKFAQPLAPANEGAEPPTAVLPPDIQAEIDAIDVRLRHMRERNELQDRLLSEMDRQVAQYETDPGDEFMRANMQFERATLAAPGHEPDPGDRLMRAGLQRERAEMDVARNDPGISSQMGADPGYGFTRQALRRERAGLAAARAVPEPPGSRASLFPPADEAVQAAHAKYPLRQGRMPPRAPPKGDVEEPTLASARRQLDTGGPGGRPKRNPVRNPKKGIPTRKQGAGLRAAGMEVLDLAEIRRQRLGAGPEDWEEIDRRLNWYRKPKGEKPAGDGERGIFEEFTGAFSHSLAESNPEMYGAALEAAGILAGSDDMSEWGKDMQEWAKSLDIGTPPSVPSISDIDSFGTAMRYIFGGLGSGIGSTMPSLVGGAAGALAGSMVAPGPGTVVGAAAGAMLPAAPLNMGEAYLQFIEEGLTKETAAKYAAYITPALTALDTAGLLKAVGGALTRDARRTMLSHIARSAARGFTVEGVTEGLQSALREGTAAALTGNPDMQERAMRVLNEATIGALTGGAIGGAAGTAARRQGAKPPSEEEIERERDALPDVEDAANEAATSPANDLPEPTDAQKEAGNYKVGRVKLQGLDISIENPKGSVRSGKGKDGKEWSVTMPAHYGYVRRTEGADGDQVDIYLSDRPAQNDPVFIVDQVDADTGKFDEHKAFIGFPTQEQVEKIYDAAFDDGKGPQRRQAIRSMPMDEFKTWLQEGDTTKPAAEAPQAAPDEPVTVKASQEPAKPDRPIAPAPAAPQAPSDEEQKGLFPPAPEGKPEVSRETQAEPDPSRDTYSFTPEQLHIDPKRFQFKSGSDVEGQTGRLQGVTKWNPDAGGRLMVWQDNAGKYWVIDGHQRSGLARRLKSENPDADIRLNASLLREADGVTAEEARTTAAMRNIMEGNASAIDAAKVFRNQPALLESKELPISQDLVRQAQSLARLGDEAFGMAVNEVVAPHFAAAVGKLVPLEKGQPNDPLQQAVMQVIAEAAPPNIVEAESIIRDVVAAGSTREVQQTLFGDLELEIPLYRARAQVLAWAKRKTAFLKRVFGNLVKNEALIASQGNTLDTALNEQKADTNARLGLIIDALATRKGPVSDALTKAAKGILEDGRSVASVGPEFLKAVEEAGRAGNLLGEADGGSAVSGLAPAPDLFDAAALPASDSQATQVERAAGERVERRPPSPQPKGTPVFDKVDEETYTVSLDGERVGEIVPSSTGARVGMKAQWTPTPGYGRVKVYKDAESAIADLTENPPAKERETETAPAKEEEFHFSRTAWHGSPHRFEKFSSVSIGTGEGAQTYGHGLYFSDKEEVADFYRDNLAGASDILVDGDPLPRKGSLEDISNALAERLGGASKIQANSFITKLAFNGGYVPDAMQAIRDRAKKSSDPHEKREAADFVAKARDRITTQKSGAKYKVNLAPQENEYLYWDRTLDQQPKKVREALKGLEDTMGTFFGQETPRGRDIYDRLASVLNKPKPLESEAPSGWAGWESTVDQRAASEALLAAGIKGIKYLDQLSRAIRAPTGQTRMPLRETFNYVLFNDSDVTVDEILQSRQAQDAPPKPIGKAGVEAAIAPIVDSWKSEDAPKVVVVESAADLPQVAKDHIARTPGAGSIDGLFHVGADTVYLIGDQVRNAEQARRVLAHEVVGHYSMMQMLGDEFPAVVRDVNRLVKREAPAVKRIADQVRRDYGKKISDNEFATEVIAHMAEEGVRHPVMKRAVAQVRRFLRSLGFRLPFNVAEIEDMISRAGKRLKKPSPRQAQASPTPDVAQAQDRFFRSISQQHQKRRFYPVDRLFRLMMYPVGGINERGEWKYAPPIQKAGRKIIREAKPNPDGAFGWMGPFIEYARSGWLNRYGTPEDFITRERRASSDKFRIELEGLAFVEALGKDVVTQEEAEALQAILEGKPLNDARLKALAGPIRESLDKYGRELVDLGLLAEETYLQNLGEWLHRSYRKYEQDQPPLVRWAQRRGKKRRQALIGDELKVRGKIHKAPPVERLLQDVPGDLKADARKAKAWRIFDRVSGENDKVISRVYWPDGIAVPQGEVWDKGGSWNDRGKWDLLIAKGRKPLLRQDYTEAERAEMGEIRDARFNILKSYRLLAHDIAQGRLFKDIAEQPEWFSKTKPDDVIVDAAEAGSVSPYLGIGWVQVPDTLIPKSNQKRWGVLSGGWIRACIWRDMVELNKMQNPGTWHWILRQYKQNKTSRSFKVHFNNTMSNVFLADLHDLTAADLTAAIMEFINKGKFYQEAVENGIFSGGYARNELQHNEASRALRKALKLSEAKANPNTNFHALWNILASADNALRSAYQWEDEIFRLTTYMRDRLQGDDPIMAARNAIDRFLNYDIRAPWPNALRRSVLPFFSYTYASVPQIMKATVARPWKLAKLFTLGYLLNELSYELTGGDEERERAVMADRDQGYTWLGLPRLLRMPFLGPNEDPLYMDLSRVIPGGGMLETDMGQAGLPEFLLIGGPLSMAADVLWNRVAFSGEDIVNREIDTGVEAAQKRMTYLWRAAMPNLPFLPGSWSWKMLNQAITDERDIFGRQYSIPLAAVRAFGPNMKPQDPEYQYLMRQFDMRRERKELKRRMYQISSDRNRRRIGKGRFDRELKDFQERMNALAEREAELDRKFRGLPEKK